MKYGGRRMKITNVELIPIRSKLEKPLRFSFGIIEHRNFALIRISTDEGLEGWGETSVNFPYWSIQERLFTIIYGIKPLLIGENPLEVKRLWRKMISALLNQGLQWGAKGAIYQAISGVDIALWDILGKASGLPLYQMLGGYAKPIRAYAVGLDPSDQASHAGDCASEGFTAVKVRVGFDERSDLELVRETRRVIGYDVDLMVDANMAWGRHQALKMAKALEEYSLYWLEEPTRCDDLESLKWISERIGIPLAAGENAFDILDAARLIHSRAVRFIMPDVSRCGGITGAQQICNFATAHGIEYSPHAYGTDIALAGALHLMASVPGGVIAPYDVSKCPAKEEIFEKPITIKNGYFEIPSSPGIGIEINEKGLEKFRWDPLKLESF
ncbi:MAG: mandelate racemase/muconate lactonizing enzyme family protein [Candidatus Bathyarchaeia archaeon]